MSTVPHDPTDAAHTQPQATVLPVAGAHLDEVVRQFEAAAGNLGVELIPPAELRQLCRQVASFTAELFPGGMAIEMRVDPEIRDDLYLVFEVVGTGDVDNLVACDEQWHRHVLLAARQWPGLFRLLIDAR